MCLEQFPLPLALFFIIDKPTHDALPLFHITSLIGLTVTGKQRSLHTPIKLRILPDLRLGCFLTMALNLSILDHSKCPALLKAARLDRPIGSLLLLWPTLAALWIAAGGIPSLHLLIVFSLGTLLTRSAGCVVNDLADQKLDKHVKRTALRPLATGEITSRDAIEFLVLLLIVSFGLVLTTNLMTIAWAIGAVAAAGIYPFLKRITHLPQVGLGIAFSFGIPMAFAATGAPITAETGLLFWRISSGSSPTTPAMPWLTGMI